LSYRSTFRRMEADDVGSLVIAGLGFCLQTGLRLTNVI